MWDMRRWLNPTPLPPRRCTIKFSYPALELGRQDWWLVVDQGKVDLCLNDPGYDVDLFVTGSLRSMTAIWMGISTVTKEVDEGQLELIGDAGIAKAMQAGLGLSPFAGVERNAA
jgi:hypothetical protein